MNKQTNYFVCQMCGRCYETEPNSRELSEKGEKKMVDHEKSWNKQAELYVCCRENHDKWRIAGNI